MFSHTPGGPPRARLRARRAATATAAAGLTVALLAGCAAAPLAQGFLYERYERVPPATATPQPTTPPPMTPEPTGAPDAPDGGSDEPPVATATPGPTATDAPGTPGPNGFTAR